MAQYATLIAAIQSAIKQNGNNEITGELLQQSLLAMINSLGSGYQYAGVATPTTNPGTPDQRVFYLASQPGTYSNFGALVVTELSVLRYDSTWHLDSLGIGELAKWIETQTTNVSAQISTTGKHVYPTGQIFDSSGQRISGPIAVSKGDIVVVRTIINAANVGIISVTNSSGNIVKPVVLGGLSSTWYNYVYRVEADGYVMLCTHLTYYEAYIEKNSVIREMTEKMLTSKKVGNNVWVTNQAATPLTLNYLFNGVPRIDIYNAFRSIKITGVDSSVERSLEMIWKNYSNYFRIIIMAKINGTWTRTLDSGNIQMSTVAPTGNEVINFKFTQGTTTVECVIDMSMIPEQGGTFNAQSSEPEFCIAPSCYESGGSIDTSSFVKVIPQTFTDAQKLQARTNIGAVGAADGAVVLPQRIFPNAKLPCVSFQFDDVPDNDDLVVELFDLLGVRCNFAFIASDALIASKGAKYLALNKRGYGICSHSIDGTIYNTTNYTRETALAALQASKNKLEKLGMTINGFVSPSSQMASEFFDLVEMTYGYAFTHSDGYAGNRIGNPCRNGRESMEASTLAYLKGRIDNAIAWGYNVTFYGHSSNFGNTIGGEEWNIAKLRSLVEYAIEKRDTGKIFFGNTDDCFAYFYGPNLYNVNLSGDVGAILPEHERHYYLRDLTAGTISYNSGKLANCEMLITTASGYQSGSLVFASGYKFNAVPNIGASETWHLKFIQGCIIATKLS